MKLWRDLAEEEEVVRNHRAKCVEYISAHREHGDFQFFVSMIDAAGDMESPAFSVSIARNGDVQASVIVTETDCGVMFAYDIRDFPEAATEWEAVALAMYAQISGLLGM